MRLAPGRHRMPSLLAALMITLSLPACTVEAGDEAAHALADKFAADSDSRANPPQAPAPEAAPVAAVPMTGESGNAPAARRMEPALSKTAQDERKQADARRAAAEKAEAARRAQAQREADEQEMLARARAEAEERRLEQEMRLREIERAEADAAQRAQEEQRKAAEARRQAEIAAAEEARRVAAERERKEEEQRKAAEARRQAEIAAAEEARRLAAERERREEEQRKAAEARRQAEIAAAEEARRVAAERERLARLEAEREQELQRLSDKLRRIRESRIARDVQDAPPYGLGAQAREEPGTGMGRASRPSDTRVTILLIMQPGSRGIRRFNKTADPILCVEGTCYLSQGANTPAEAMSRGKAFGPGVALGQRAGNCSHSLTCVFRGIDLGHGAAEVQPIDLRILRHDRREPRVVEADPTCRTEAGRLICRRTVLAGDYAMWVVPEAVAEQAGGVALETAVRSGLSADLSASLSD